jgi:hypothetical protein
MDSGRKATIALIMISVAAAVSAEGQSQTLVRDRDGSVICVLARAGSSDAVTVLIRSPGNPAEELVARVPPERRDVSALPARVVLATSATDEKSRQRRPTAIEALVDYPVIEAERSAEPFTRVTFPRSSLKAGAVILAERTIALSDTERVTVQTSCRITEVEEVKLR